MFILSLANTSTTNQVFKVFTQCTQYFALFLSKWVNKFVKINIGFQGKAFEKMIHNIQFSEHQNLSSFYSEFNLI